MSVHPPPASGPRFGIWAAVHGSRAAHQDPDEPFDASWERNRDQMLLAERLGYDSVLIAQHTINPHDESRDQLEAWTSAAALAALTARIELIAAIKPYLYHPVVLAKMALNIENISRGRFAINLINAWNRPELERSGIGFAPHDERYAYGSEWIQVVNALVSGQTLTHHGTHFQIDQYRLRPGDLHRPRPRVYVGGESEPARALVAAHGDTWFINGQPLADVSALIADLRRRPRPEGAGPLAFGLSAFVIARDTDAQAEAEHQRLLALAALDAPQKALVRGNIDPQAQMFKTFAASPRVGSNGGTAAGLVGSHATVAQRIVDFHRAGIELFMLQFQPFEAEMQRFAEHVRPRVQQLLLRDAAASLAVA